MLDDIEMEALRATFSLESEQLLVELENALLLLELEPDDADAVATLFRAAHTLKGGALIVGLATVAKLSNLIEEALSSLRGRKLRADTELVSLLLRAADVLRGRVHSASEGPLSAAEQAPYDQLATKLAVTGPRVGASLAPDMRVEGMVELAPAGASVASTLRVDVEKLDRILRLLGEITIAREVMGQVLARDASSGVPESALDLHRDADRLFVDLREQIMRARMVPIGQLFRLYARSIRDIALAQGKQVRLILEGEDVEVDTSVIERVRDPLLHLVRNAIDHGIETPEQRISQGKVGLAQIELRAYSSGGSLVIQVVDDGLGLDRARILSSAEASGAELPEGMSDADVYRLIFVPGFSTREVVSEVSGRGVGLDVVKRNVEALSGRVDVESRRGQGTTFSLRLPLTVAIIAGFVVRVGDDRFVIPLEAVHECVELPSCVERTRQGSGVLRVRGKSVPFISLRRRFDLPHSISPQRENVVIVRVGQELFGITADELLGEAQTVIRPLGSLLRPARGISGSTISGNGAVALILDVEELYGDLLKSSLATANERLALGEDRP